MTVFIDVITENTATVRAGDITAHMLDEAGAPRQYDRERRCWTTSRRALPDLLAWLDDRRWRVVFNDLDKLLEIDHGAQMP